VAEVSAAFAVFDDVSAGSRRPTFSLDERLKQKAADIDLETALRDANAPPQVAAMLHSRHNRSDSSRHDDDAAQSPEAGVQSMNKIIARAQERLDHKVIECKQFAQRTERTMGQMRQALALLGEQLANNAWIMNTATGAISDFSSRTQALKERELEEKLAYQQAKQLDASQLEQRQKDLKEAEAMLDLTACKSMLLDRGAASGEVRRATSTSFEACFAEAASSDSGTLAPAEIRFSDARLAGVARTLSQEGQALLRLALGSAQTPIPSNATKVATSVEDNGKLAQKCVEVQSGCGALHDAFASLWGDLKDLVDESRAKLHQDDVDWAGRRDSIHSQLEALTAQQGLVQTDIAQATMAKASLLKAQEAKRAENAALSQMVRATGVSCKAAVQHIASEVAAAMRVRNELVSTKMAGAKASDIVDCAVSDWTPSPCPVPCDDTLKGGEQVLRRDIVVRGSRWGAPCPKLEYKVQCNQVKCPVDCKLGPWSAFSACTRDCDGGLQTRKRVQLQKPMFGGQSCDALLEARACNTGACDQDCKLGGWTNFTRCSRVCGTGYRERRRGMLAPARGGGQCPSKDDGQRLQMEACNKQPCVGDEICAQPMDLVIAIDGSGSLTEEGFEVMKTFAAKLVKRFRASGPKKAKVGVVQFGNGRLDKDRVVADAILVSDLSENIEDVSRKISGMSWRKGFTNLAQALLKARNALLGGRTGAEHVVVVLTDGRPSFKTQARQAADGLHGSARLMVVQVHEVEEAVLKSFASAPWQTNYLHVPGKDALKSDYDAWAAQALVGACPGAASPSKKPSL